MLIYAHSIAPFPAAEIKERREELSNLRSAQEQLDTAIAAAPREKDAAD